MKLLLILSLLISFPLLSFDKTFEEKSTKHNRLQLLTNGVDLKAKRIEILKRAYSSIYIATFTITPDEEISELLDIMCEKSKKGVDVRVIVDALGGRPFMDRAEELNDQCGIRTMFYGALEWDLIEAPNAFHSKIMLVDGRDMIVGGSNWSKKYFHASKDDQKWYDLDMFVMGEEACRVHNEFITMYKWGAEQIWGPEKFYNPDKKAFADYHGQYDYDLFMKKYGGKLRTCTPIPIGNSRAYTVFGDNWRFKSKHPIEDTYVENIKNAKEYIRINSPYSIPNKKMRNLLFDAVKRGVKVEYMTNSRESSDESAAFNYIQYLAICDLILHGVEVNLWQKSSTYHRKGGVFDGEYAFIGSDNFDIRGQKYAAESVTFTDDQKVIDEFNAMFKESKASSKIAEQSHLLETLMRFKTKTKALGRIIEDYL